jgi:hypothetical protein
MVRLYEFDGVTVLPMGWELDELEEFEECAEASARLSERITTASITTAATSTGWALRLGAGGAAAP